MQVLPEKGWCPSLTEATEEPPASPHELATTVPGQAACTMNLEKAGEGTRGMWPGQRAVCLLGGTHVGGLSPSRVQTGAQQCSPGEGAVSR